MHYILHQHKIKNKNLKNNVGQRKEKGRGKRRQGGLTRKFATKEGKRVIRIKKKEKKGKEGNREVEFFLKKNINKNGPPKGL